MFLRVRGKGASPENSQATVMHIRGFRHINTIPPAGGYTVLTRCDNVRARPYAFSHFNMGVQAHMIINMQRQHLSGVKPELSPMDAAMKDTMERMVWKETWNVYDIIYDEVPLLPPTFDVTNAQLRVLADVADRGADDFPKSAERFTLPSQRKDNQKAVVCSHYFALEAIQADVLEKRSSAALTLTPAKPAKGPVVVVDLSHVPPAEAALKLAVELAWSTAFVTTQPDNVLLRASAVVVRTPYDTMPSADQLEAAAANAANDGDAAHVAACALEMIDFLGQHLSLVHQSFTYEPTLPWSAEYPVPPPVQFIGKQEASLQQAVTELRSSAAEDGVVLLINDHRAGDVDARSAEAQRWSAAWQMPVLLTMVPCKALIDGGDEPWDPYTQRERERLNFCPCCGDCNHEH